MTGPCPPISRRGFAGLGAATLATMTYAANAQGRPAAGRSSAPVLDVIQAPFFAAGDGVRDDAPAIERAVAALPDTGGTVTLPGARTYILGHTITDGGKPVTFQIGHASIVGPVDGPIFDLTTNGSSVSGVGPGATILRTSPQRAKPQAPLYALELADGSVHSARVMKNGKGLRTTPLLEVDDSPAGDGAALIAAIANEEIVRTDLVATGRGYAAAPAIKMLGGGECAIRIHEASHCRVADLTIDLMNLPQLVGIFQNGGWYADLCRVEIRETSLHPTAIALLIDSHTLGEPGRNGTYGGAYLGRYTQLAAKRVYVVGHDTSTASTLHFDTLDTAHLHLHAVIATTVTNGVFQAGGDAFLDLVNVDGLSMVGGDVEGRATLIRSRGVCNNVRLAPLAYSGTGEVTRGPIGTGWRLDLAKANSPSEILYTGNGGSGAIAFQNSGWVEKHRAGLQYTGDSIVYSSNVRMTGPSSGVLDNPKNPGLALIMDISGQLIVRRARPGVGQVALEDVARIDDGGLEICNLPSSRPPAGSKRLWFDPADGFRVKFEP